MLRIVLSWLILVYIRIKNLVFMYNHCYSICPKFFIHIPGEELVLDFEEVALAHVHLEGLVDDCEAGVILNVLPSAVAVTHNSCRQNQLRN